MLTAETLPRHELAGLDVEVVASSDPDLVGVAGRVVDETERTLLVESTDDDTAASRVRQVPKAAATFEFSLPDGTYVTVRGERLVANPARRTETTGDSRWR